ncbi:unnamed protein product [Schistosoma turkestanicum]|nr:unnamed protein product [Schistosoma turkestanicum]
MTGYILTYNQQERLAHIETYRLLNHTLDEVLVERHESEACKNDSHVNANILFGSKPSDTVTNEKNEDADDLYSQLVRENCSNDPSNSKGKFSFYSLKTHISNCSFILHQTNLLSAAELCNRVFERLLSNSNAESRYVLRLMPVVKTCRSDLQSLQNCVQQAWSNFLKLPSCEIEVPPDQPSAEKNESNNDESSILHVPTQTACESTLKGPKTFMIMFKSRGFKAISRDDAIHRTIGAIKSVDSSWNICNSSPSVVISITVLCKVTCISLLENFFKYRKYNIAEVCSPSLNYGCIKNTKNDESE